VLWRLWLTAELNVISSYRCVSRVIYWQRWTYIWFKTGETVTVPFSVLTGLDVEYLRYYSHLYFTEEAAVSKQETAKSLAPITVRVRRTTSFRVSADLKYRFTGHRWDQYTVVCQIRWRQPMKNPGTRYLYRSPTWT